MLILLCDGDRMPNLDTATRFHAVFDRDTPAQREQLIRVLDEEGPANPLICIPLRREQILALSAYLLLLPEPEFRIMALYYCMRYPYTRIEKIMRRPHARGTIAYYKDRLTQCMNLPRPIAEPYWPLACANALEQYPFASAQQKENALPAKPDSAKWNK